MKQTQETESVQLSVLDRLTGRTTAYKAGIAIGEWKRYVAVRNILLKYRDDAQDMKQKTAAIELLLMLRRRFE